MNSIFKSPVLIFALIGLTACDQFVTNQPIGSNPKLNLTLASTSAGTSQFYVQNKQFLRRSDGSAFVPHGVNYIRLARIGSQPVWHSNFNLETYNRTQTLQDLGAIKNYGYNLVRVFISHTGISGIPEGSRLNPTYMANLRDFLSIARSLGLYVKLTTAWLPDSYLSKISEYRSQDTGSTPVVGVNATTLDSAYIKA